ncbi:curli-like amyloid fiber formation chaperone CsgH [Pontibacter virosus]|uniref:Curli assembly protein CsgC n=1 Tax=Pontibacter virosus TaxID=1765052 RepID=A0A2U1B2P1_9BACT|nr:hypothetical protein C8E01_10294 [Pontibacter virosus]
MIMFNVDNIAPTASQCMAHMNIQRGNGLLVVSGMFENKSPQTVYLSYKFKCIRVSATGRSANSQSGSFVAAPDQIVSFSKTSLCIRPSDSYDLLLEIYDGKLLLASQALAVPQL